MLPALLPPQSVFCHSCGARSDIPDYSEASSSSIACPACESAQTELSPYLPDTYITRRPSRDEVADAPPPGGRLSRRPSLIESEEHQAAVISLVRLYERGQIPDVRFIELLAEFSRDADDAPPVDARGGSERYVASAGMARFWRAGSLGLDDTPVCEALLERLEESKQAGFCTICSDSINERDKAIQLASGCGHFFHSDCIKHWFTKRNTCPTCRHEYPTDGVEFLRSIGCHEEAYELAVKALLQRQKALKDALEVLRYVHQELALASRRSSLSSGVPESDDFEFSHSYRRPNQFGEDDERSGSDCSSDDVYSSGADNWEHFRARSYPASPRTMNHYGLHRPQEISTLRIETPRFTGFVEHDNASLLSNESAFIATHSRSRSAGSALDRGRFNIMQYTVASVPFHSTAYSTKTRNKTI
ncbi:hypothetical protein FOL47_005345 [Perkinsus chesapeaki]|uniref:RING-type domain-containing protein n=1 Tax=Perkinsus chesapeaki TaxID=330153 RepID=A0A7J6N3C0_PERCH|nr:hypothetical protein FOL47_005345 [Perkinsus chesapeaki]